ncbi:MAG: dethiobiotin synthase [Pseudomonadales bacterium]|jgi:dethiobiotin synthetase|nr:dethiobiotin synthase [Pseudomonadales bacterium]
MNAAQTRRAYFVTGTDTEVGKTLVSCLLLHAAAARGLDTLGLKPLAAGAQVTPEGLRNDDALRLIAAATRKLPYAQVNPVCLPEPLSPHLSARRAGKRLNVERLVGFCRGALQQRADFTVIEGAGGWRVPLNTHEYLSDLPKILQIPVVLVVGLRLGCLNHALLSAETILRDGLTLAGWVANTLDPTMPERDANIATLRDALDAPLLGVIPRLPEVGDLRAYATLLDLSLLDSSG